MKTTSRRSLLSCCALPLSVLLTAQPAQSQIDSTWTVTSGSGDWHDPANWSDGVPQQAGDKAVIPSNSGVPTVGAPATLGQLEFGTLSGIARVQGDQLLTFDQPGTEPARLTVYQARRGLDVTLFTPLAIATGESLEIDVANTSSIDLAGPIQAGSGDILKVGIGTLGLSGDNSAWSGRLSILDGTLEVLGNQALGANEATLTLSGSVLQFDSLVSGKSISLEDAKVLFTGTGNRLAGDLDLHGTSQISTANQFSDYSLELTGNISGEGSLQIVPDETAAYGTLRATIALRGDNSYTGITRFKSNSSSDSFQIASATALGSPAAGTTIDGGRTTISATIAEPLEILNGDVRFVLSSTTTAPILLRGGTVDLGDAPLSAPIELRNDGANPILIASELKGGVFGTGNLYLSGSVVVNSEPLSHDGGLRIVNGPDHYNGGVQFNTANSYSGPTVVEKGTLVANHPDAFGSGDSPIQVLQNGEVVIKAQIDREYEVGGTLIIDDPAIEINRTVRLGGIDLPYPASGSILGVGTFNGEVALRDGPSVRPYLRGGTFNGPITGSPQVLTISANDTVTLNGDNSYEAITDIQFNSGSGVVEVNSSTSLGSSQQGSLVEGGNVLLNVATDEPIVVIDRGRVDVNVQQNRLPRLFSSTRFNPPRTQVVAINHSGVYPEAVDVFEGTVEVNAGTSINDAVIRGGGKLVVALGSSLQVKDSDIELQSGHIEGTIKGVSLLRKTSGLHAELGDLPNFAGDISVQAGRLLVTHPRALGSLARATHVVGKDAVLQFDQSVSQAFSEDIFLHNAMGDGFAPGLFIARGGIRLNGRLDLGNDGSSVGGLKSGGGNSVLELAGEITGGDLVTRGSQCRVRILTSDANFKGNTDIVDGTVELADAGRVNSTSAIRLHEGADSFDGRLDLNNREVKFDDRIPDAVPIEFLGGSLVSNGELDETVGTLHFVEGDSEINLFPSSTERTYDKQLTITKLERDAGAVARVHVSPTVRADVSQQPTLSHGIVPWLLAIDHLSSSSRPFGFATFSERGIVPLTDYDTNIDTATAASNVRLSRSTTLTAAQTHINSLSVSNGGDILDLNGSLLTVESGGILEAHLVNGRVTAGQGGGHELIFHQAAQIDADIVDDGDRPVSVTISGRSTSLSGSNSYSGTTYVNKGTLVLQSEDALPDGADLRISGGEVQIGYSSADTKHLGNVRIAEGGSFGRRSVDHGVYSFDYLDFEEGMLAVEAVVGSGSIVKSSIGDALVLANADLSTYNGQVLVESGELKVLGLPHASYIVQGGALAVSSATHVELAGGDLLVGESYYSFSNPVPDAIIHVSKASRIVSQGEHPTLTMSQPITGDAPLTFTGRAISEPRESAAVSIASDSPEFSGNVLIDTVPIAIRKEQSLGSGDIAVGPGGSLQLSPIQGTYDNSRLDLQNDVYLFGGEIRGFGSVFRPQQLLGDLHAEAQSFVSSMNIVGDTYLADGATLTTSGDSPLQFLGEIKVGGNTKLEYGLNLNTSNSANVELLGTISTNAKRAELNFINRGLDEIELAASLHASEGQTLALLKDGEVFSVPLSGEGIKVGGRGTIASDIALASGAAVAPGNSPGTLTVDGNVTMGPGAVYEWEVGADGWDMLSVTQTLAFAATPESPWRFDISELAIGPAIEDSEWLIATAAAVEGFDRAAVRIVANSGNPVFDGSLGDRFSLDLRGTDLFLVLQVPESATIAMSLCLGLPLLLVRRRHRLRIGR